MNKPYFRDMNSMIAELERVNQELGEIYDDAVNRDRMVEIACRGVLFADSINSLENIDVEELAKTKAGIRVSALRDAGFTNLKLLAKAQDREIRAVEGVGDKQLKVIRDVIAELQNQLVEYSDVKLVPDDYSEENISLIKAIYHYIHIADMFARDAVFNEEYGFFNYLMDKIHSRNYATSDVKWFFSGRKKKEATVMTMEDVSEAIYGNHYKTAKECIAYYDNLLNTPPEVVMEDFEKNSPTYYAVLDLLGGDKVPKPLIYSSIPAQLAMEVDGEELDLSGFIGNLRRYQVFGAKYILHQGRVLLGDDMGLGKTVQAIAVMAHLYSKNPLCHFLVVCPASVLVNWVREVKKFSSIPVYLVHGADLDKEFDGWSRGSGVCITNYETMGKILDGIDNKMNLELMVIDEAHYIKNPDAKRTKYIHALENESNRILLMTGTPLENKVEEMCTLIDFIRPDMSDMVRSVARMSKVPEFREMVSDVYLRRLRSDVLNELPEIERKAEWCQLTDLDRNFYVKALANKNFNDMRRVSFLQEDLGGSSKAMRLLELIGDAKDDGRKVVVYSYFRETVHKAVSLLGSDCAGVITGSTEPERRQEVIDSFTEKDVPVLVAQIQAGGTGLNIQAASIVIFLEPQVKPSLENQALSRVYRMGQIRNVLVYHLLCPDTIDEAMLEVLWGKQNEFNLYAHESALGEASENLIGREWIRDFMMREERRYLTGE